MNDNVTKYVYCNGSINEARVYKTSIQMFWKTGAISWFDKQDILRNPQFKIVDNPEDLIEVGDMVRCNVSDMHKLIMTGVVEEVDKRKAYQVACDSFGVEFETVIEIWKRIDNTFVKICHKEYGEWKVDGK